MVDKRTSELSEAFRRCVQDPAVGVERFNYRLFARWMLTNYWSRSVELLADKLEQETAFLRHKH